MNELEQKTISSREVAEMMEVKRHSDMLDKIDKINQVLNNGNFRSSDYWCESTYKQAGNGKECREYQVTKKGCELIAHKTEGEKGVVFTVKYMERFEQMEQEIKQPRMLTTQEIMREQLSMIDNVSDRVTALENNMTIDYSQQLALEKLVNKQVTDALGGKDTNAYKEISKKVFKEIGRDIKSYFNVNSRNNIAVIDFDKARQFIQNWKPCYTTQLLINDCNAQMCII